MVTFFPELDEIKKLRVPPTEGENYLLNFLAEYLGRRNGEFEVYFQPAWDGSFPDVVIMRKNHGVMIIEVKDWNLALYSLQDNDIWNYDGNSKKSPIAQARFYKDLFYNTYSRTLASLNLRDSRNYSLVSTAVFFYGPTESTLANFFGAHCNYQKGALMSNYIALLTKDILARDGLQNIPNANFLLGNYTSKFFTDDVYNELHRVLKPSEFSKMKSAITLSAEQRNFAKSEANTKRKVKGPAGCGKTTVLAYRAVDAYRRTGNPVLILTFNITLCNYIRDCISAALDTLPNIRGRKKAILKTYFKINHVHMFISNYRNQTGQFDKVKFEDGKKKYVKTNTLEEAPIKYSTILVDETQDYEREWLETIVNDLLDKDGEIIFFGDEDQNIYERENMTKVSIPKVPGAWNKLKGTYRLTSRIAELARDFQLKFFGGSVGNEIDPQMNLFDETSVKYYYFNSFNVGEIVRIVKKTLSEGISNDDICIMSQIIANVRPIDKVLRDTGYKTMTTFETEEEYQFIIKNTPEDKVQNELDKIRRPAKFAFNMESGNIKLSTIHSYKGWGIPTEILIIGGDESSDQFLNAAMVYTGITRAIQNLIIINIGVKDYDKFFSDWTKSHN